MKRNGVQDFRVEDLTVSVHATNAALGLAAAEEAGTIIRHAIDDQGTANVILATGNSQLTFLDALQEMDGISWAKVVIFHLDEYVGIDPIHPASFPNFLRRHFVDRVRPKAFHPLTGSSVDAARMCRDYERLLRAHPIDLCALGIGENGHLAFNDPPFADFDDPVWVKTVRLAEASRRQQVREGHFDRLDEVPTEAITLTIPAIFSARRLLVMVPEARKADAVARTLRDPISEDCPATLLRHTAKAHLFLDAQSGVSVASAYGSREG